MIFAEDLRSASHEVRAHDLKLSGKFYEPLREHARRHGVKLSGCAADAVRGSSLVLSAVTADQAVAVAAASAPHLDGGAFFLDLNSASPGAKVHAAALIERAGGRYVEGAMMTSVPPYRLRVPMLIGGPHAASLQPQLLKLGFAATVLSSHAGLASATKMCRSVVIKGLEATVIECLTAARHFGVEDAVIASFRETFPGIDWERQATSFFQRVIKHGRRRSEEARQVAVTVQEAGLQPWSALATATRQEWMADLADLEVFGQRESAEFASSADWRVEADRILAACSLSISPPVATQPQSTAELRSADLSIGEMNK